MTKKTELPRLETGVRNLDAVFGGGLPKGSVIVLAGPPGSGKTILTQQFCFHNASAKSRVLYFNTLSEPTAKTLRYMSQFHFFDARKLDDEVRFVDLGLLIRTEGLEKVCELIMERIKEFKPAIVVVDSFKVFDDMAASRGELRKFGYQVAVNLMAWEATALLLGEYGPGEYLTNPLFSIVDGLVVVTQREASGEQQRFLQAVKLRGAHHSTDEQTFVITESGIEVYAPRVTIQRQAGADTAPPSRCRPGISKLDDLLGEGIPRGSSLLVAGVAGTGKTVLLLEFVYRGALAGEKGIVFSFEETEERLLAAARGLGWDLEKQMKRGMVELVFIPQPNIVVEKHLLMMHDRIRQLGAQRVAVDSISVFLHKIKDPQVCREKTFQLASIVQNEHAVGFFATDIPYGANMISRFGVEETVVDGVLLLSSTEEGRERQRYIEVYKLRNTAHLRGRHNMTIGHGGISVFPRYSAEEDARFEPASIDTSKRLSSGVPKLDDLMGGGLLARSITLVSGSAGTGKTTLGLHFVLEGAKRREPGLYVTLEEGPAQVIESATALGLPLEKAVEKKLVDVVYFPREHVRAGQFLAVLTDKIQKMKARRLVLDSVTHMSSDGDAENVHEMLNTLAGRFRALGVTTVLTLESASMHDAESVTGRRFSPVADNLVMLRYTRGRGGFQPTLSVVKTRGSAHDRGRYYYEIGEGGLRLGERVVREAAAATGAAKRGGNGDPRRRRR